MARQINSRQVAGVIQPVELRDKLQRVRAALGAAERAPDTGAARKLRTELAQQVQTLERDLSRYGAQDNGSSEALGAH